MKELRQELIDFLNYLNEESDTDWYPFVDEKVDDYLKSINKALDEAKTVNNNEQTKEVCAYCGKNPQHKQLYVCKQCLIDFNKPKTN